MKIASIAIAGGKDGTVLTVKLSFPAGVNLIPIIDAANTALLQGSELDSFRVAQGPDAPPAQAPAAPAEAVTARRSRGRPPGSPNKARAPLPAVAPLPETTVAPTSRRRRAPDAGVLPASPSPATALSAAPQSPSNLPSDVADADLAKAASAAAAVLGPRAVMEHLIKDYNVKGVQELQGPARRAFLGSLKALLPA